MTKDQLYQEMYMAYLKGYSLQEVGKKYGVTRQSVYAGFRNRNFELRKNQKLPSVIFNGNKYTLRNTGYYGRTNGERNLLHRDVWEKHYGKIPNSHDIHHKDHDKTNNNINNLELLRKDDHARKFATGNNQYSKKSMG